MFYIDVKFSKYVDFTVVIRDNAFVLKYITQEYCVTVKVVNS